MRGARYPRGEHKLSRGIIPADAGSTGRPRHCKPSNKDHPRGCGEHRSSLVRHMPYSGSSPRMRGAQRRPDQQSERQRIIPADAGSTPGRAWEPEKPGDHPRGCGEHSGMTLEWALVQGSSPRMRGAPLARSRHVVCLRIIPADAGSTRGWHRRTAGRWDHPRGCGEHTRRAAG